MSFLRVLAFAGGEWVIWALIILSVLAVAVILEKIVLFHRNGVLFGRQSDDFEKGMERSGEGYSFKARAPFFERRFSQAGMPAQAEAARIEDRLMLERRLVILGSLGALAPFIGLFGTVLGIIKAFRDLAQVGVGHPEIVMQGIAEALIATAAGIFVAIICVASYNFFNRRIKDSFLAAARLELRYGSPASRR